MDLGRSAMDLMFCIAVVSCLASVVSAIVAVLSYLKK